MAWLQIVLVSAVSWLFCYLYGEFTLRAARRKMTQEYGCKPATRYRHKDPILGLDLILAELSSFKEHKILEHIQKRYLEYKTYTLEVLLFGKKAILTDEPENIKTILSLKFADYSIPPIRAAGMIPTIGRGIFTGDGAAWEHSRALLRPSFTRSQVGDLAALEIHVGHLINALPRDGSTVDLQDYFFRLTIDSATQFLFGESTNCLVPGLDSQSKEGFETAFTYCTGYMGKQLRLGWLGGILPDRTYHKNKKIIDDFADRYIQKALDQYQYRTGEKEAEPSADDHPSSPYVFLHELVKQTQDPVALRPELLNIILAGRDTTTSLLSNAWFVIAKRPDGWAKLRAEVCELGGERPTYEELKNMKYVRWILNESLHLHPVVAGNSRSAIRNTVLPLGGGVDGRSHLFVPKGTHVGCFVYSMQRRPDLYGPDADKFKPERWETLRPGWEYLPFNGGPRICLGQQLALTEAAYTTVRLVQAFRNIESRDERDWMEGITITVASANGTRVGLTPSETSSLH